MSDIPKLGSKDQLPPNDTALEQTGRNGIVTFYPSGTDQDMPAVISINGDNGGVDIGGTRNKHGKLLLRDKFMTITYIIDGEKGETSQSGDIVLYDANGNERVRISGKSAELIIKSAAGDQLIHLDGKVGDVVVGGVGQDGDVVVRDSAGNETIRLDGNAGDISAGGNGRDGDVVVRDSAGNETIRLDGNAGDITAGGVGRDGDVIVRNSAGNETIRLDGNAGDISVGGDGLDGDVIVRNSVGNETIRLDGNTGDISAGGNGQDGDILIRNSTGNATVRVDGNTGHGFFNGVGIGTTPPLAASVELDVAGKTRSSQLEVTGATQTVGLTVTGATQTRDITVTDSAGNASIFLDGNAGDIRLLNADCAEDFDIVETEEIHPGTVMVLTEDGKLQQSSQAYDKRVTGVISGAGGYKPGIVLDQQPTASGKRMPVALMGKVYCKVDADQAAVEVGDLLTTAPTPGYAMKASDPYKAFGTVIGKALAPLHAGQGLIPILVALQ